MGTFIRTPIYHEISDSDLQAQLDDGQPVRDPNIDSLITKILKYVPAEIMAAFTGAVAFFSSQSSITENSKQVYTLVVFLIGVIASAAYFIYSSWIQTEEKNKAPKYFFLFSLFCFPVWALVTSSNARDAIAPFTIGPWEWNGHLPLMSKSISGIEAGDAEIALFIVAFILPALDQLLTRLSIRRAARTKLANTPDASLAASGHV